MKLELNGTELTEKLDDALITRSLQALSGDDDSFLILSKDSMSYIQTCKNGDGSFVLEYQEGSLEEHYECTDELLNYQKISMAFSSYFNGSDEWKASLKWQLMSFSSKPNANTKPFKLLVLLMLMTIVAATFLFVSLNHK